MADPDEVSRRTGVPIGEPLGETEPITADRGESLGELTGRAASADTRLSLPGDESQLDRIERKLDALLDHLGVEVDE